MSSNPEYRLELGSHFHTFSNGRWWTPDREEAERDFRQYRHRAGQIQEWRDGEFYRVVRTKGA